MYTIGQAAVRAGVSVQLLRAWERRYGIVRPERTASRYRLYDDAAIDRLRAMRQLVDSGWTASQAAREVIERGPASGMRPGAAHGDLPARRAEALARPAAEAGLGGPDALGAAFVEVAAAMDGRRLEAILDEMFARGSFETVVEAHVFPALRALGIAWERGVVSVAAEHAASHAVLRRLAAALEAAGRPDGRRPILVGLPPGSRHELGALASAAALRRRGLPVIYLGADVPIDAWVRAIRETGARGIVLAIPTNRDRRPAREVAEAAAAIRPDLLVAAGGAAAPEAGLPASVLLLSDGFRTEVDALERAFAQTRA